MVSAEPLDTTIRIVAPENISFSYRLAGPFRRLPAFIIDLVVQGVLIWGTATLLMLSGVTASMGVFFAFTFLVVWCYGGVCETYLNGRTPGKIALGIRVISIEGLPIDPQQAILRNLLRIVDISMYMAVGAASFLVTKRFQRLGDLAAGTMVIVDENHHLRTVRSVSDPRVDALLGEIPATFQPDAAMAEALASYVQRRDLLGPARRTEVARHLANSLIRRFQLPPATDPDLLLLAMYKRVYI